MNVYEETSNVSGEQDYISLEVISLRPTLNMLRPLLLFLNFNSVAKLT